MSGIVAGNRVLIVATGDLSRTEHLERHPTVPTAFLIDAANSYEERMLSKWIAKHFDGEVVSHRTKSSRRNRGGSLDSLSRFLKDNAHSYLIPVRVLWLPPEREGRRSVRWSDLLKLGDPRDPRGLRPRFIATFRRGRVAMIAAEGALMDSLIQAHDTDDSSEPLAAFVTRRAWRALDLEERKLRGNRYKTPRFVPETISSQKDFRAEVIAVGETVNLSPDKALSKARRYLNEIAANTSPLVIDLIANAIHKLYRQGYGEIRYSPTEIKEIAELGSRHPIVFLPSHRSNLDRLSLQFMLWENDLPPNHTAGGINLNFFPIGPLLRRTGVFFIRRTFRDNEIYKTVLQHYLDYLVEKRFSLEWYLEGGRSRSGRLLPPKMGLLNYVLDAQRRGKTDEIVLVPLSIAYDQIQDVPDYAREAQGKRKERESVSWLFKAVRSMRRRYGDIHIRFGEPLSTKTWSGETSQEPTLDVQKLAFEVMYRIGQVTPITPTALVSIVLLAAKGKAQTPEQLAIQCSDLEAFVAARNLPTTEELRLDDPANVLNALEWLEEMENVSSHEALGRKVFWCTDDQMIRVSYYRNMIVHFFITRSIAELAMASLENGDEESVDLFHEAALDIRDLLKFEFFFAEKEKFTAALDDDVAVDVPNWGNLLADGGASAVVEKMGTSISSWALLPFLDAYQIVGDELESLGSEYNEKKFLKDCLDRARMYRIEDENISGESASQVLFKSALRLAANRDLLEETDGVIARRQEFAAEVRRLRDLAGRGLA